MARKPRKLRTRVPLTFSDEYIAHLKVNDFLGTLTKEEIPVAKKLKLYKWDKWMKEQRDRRK